MKTISTVKGKLLFRVNDRPPINHTSGLRPCSVFQRCHLSLLKPTGAFPNSDSLSMKGRGSDALGCQCWILVTGVYVWGEDCWPGPIKWSYMRDVGCVAKKQSLYRSREGDWLQEDATWTEVTLTWWTGRYKKAATACTWTPASAWWTETCRGRISSAAEKMWLW